MYFLSSGNTPRVFTVIGSLQSCDFCCFNACNSHIDISVLTPATSLQPLNRCNSDKLFIPLSRVTYVMTLPL